jgi:hypothetical protein
MSARRCRACDRPLVLGSIPARGGYGCGSQHRGVARRPVSRAWKPPTTNDRFRKRVIAGSVAHPSARGASTPPVLESTLLSGQDASHAKRVRDSMVRGHSEPEGNHPISSPSSSAFAALPDLRRGTVGHVARLRWQRGGRAPERTPNCRNRAVRRRLSRVCTYFMQVGSGHHAIACIPCKLVLAIAQPAHEPTNHAARQHPRATHSGAGGSGASGGPSDAGRRCR